MFYFIMILSVGFLYMVVKNREKKKKKRRKQIVMLAEKMLSRQIEILGKNSIQLVTMELEIAKYLKDCLIFSISDGDFHSGDVRKAHKWLRDEFAEEFERSLQIM